MMQMKLKKKNNKKNKKTNKQKKPQPRYDINRPTSRQWTEIH